MKFNLDFNIYYAKDRLDSIRSIDYSKLSRTEIETIANYILYGKDENDSSIVDRKEVEIPTKFNSFNRSKTTSLDELIESPTFDESIILKSRSIYRKPKPELDKEKIQHIPGMKELWEEIERLEQILKQNTGELPKDPKTPTLTQKQTYFLRHQIIELRTQQYIMMDSEFPIIQAKKNKAEFHNSPADFQGNFQVLPRGLMSEENDQLFKFPYLQGDQFPHLYPAPAPEELEKTNQPIIDFRNPDHLYQLILFYEEIKFQVKNQPDSILNNLLWTLDFYIEKANLSPQQRFIVEQKKLRISNRDIGVNLNRELGILHQENYISTIWHKALGLIVAAVELNYEEFVNRSCEKAWKSCSRCGRKLLRDSRNFVKKAKAADGLTNRCKKCDKEVRG